MAENTTPSAAGLFIVRGQAIRIPEGGFVIGIDDQGKLSGSLNRIEVSLEMCSIWLRIALDQLDLAVSANVRAVQAAFEDNDQALGRELQAECAGGMQAICASAFALDAFYAALKDRSARVQLIPISSKGRSSRHRIVAEALRREFRVASKSSVNLRSIVSQVFRFRDYAVHPRADFALPVLKREVNKLTEWRFVSFGAPSATTAVRATLALLVQLVELARNPSPDTTAYLNGLRPELAELAGRWRDTYGTLTDIH